MKTILGTLGLLALVLLDADPVSGEVFLLTNGGQVTGELLNPDETLRKTFVIRTPAGVEVTLEAAEVVKRLEQSPAEIEYEKTKGRYPDTVEGQWELAEWCAKNHLSAQRKVHLERVIALDPDHKRARAALGYGQVDGKWQTQEEVMQGRGYRRYQGRWMTAQGIEVIEQKRKQENEEKAWYANVKRWSGWLGGDKGDEARREFAAIADPAAVKALAAFLEQDRRLPAQVIYVEALARIGDGEAREALAIRSIEDPVEEVRLTCLDHLKTEKHPDIVAYYVGKLKNQKDNRVVNLAAVALGQTGDASCVGPLIDALVTVHKLKVTTGKPGQTSTSFGSGGTGLSAGSSTKVVSVPMQNQAVLDALIALTGGVNFNFDVQAWQSWHASKNKRPALDARRD
jgi:hypothetical protein